MSARLGVWACFGAFISTGFAWGAGEEVKPTQVVGTLKRQESRTGGKQPATYFIEVEFKYNVPARVDKVKLLVDFGGNAALETRAAGWVGKQVAAKGKVEYRVLEPSDGSRELVHPQLISILPASEEVLTLSVTKLEPVTRK